MSVWATIGATYGVISLGLGVVVWIAVGRMLEKVDRLPDNTPVAFLQRLHGEIPTDEPDRRDSEESDKTVVVCVGDSITHGAISSNYVDLVAARLDPDTYEVINAGVNSDLAYNVTRRLDEIIECGPKVVTVLIGTNDANALSNRANLRRYMRQKQLPQHPDAGWYRDNLTRIVGQLRKCTDARVALLSIPPIGEDPDHPAFVRSQEYGEIAKEIAAEEGADYIPLGEALVSYMREHPGTPKLGQSHRVRLVAAAVFRNFVLKRSYAQISQSNGYTLLIDHLHLNDTAASIVAEMVEEYVRSGQ